MSESSRLREEYRPALEQVYMAAIILAGLPLREMLNAIGGAETVGAILDPTLYREKAAAMAEDKKVIRAAMALAAIGKEVADEKAGV